MYNLFPAVLRHGQDFLRKLPKLFKTRNACCMVYLLNVGTQFWVSGHFTPKTFHPKDISPRRHFTPRTFHPTDISPHFLKNEYNESSGIKRKNSYCVIDV